MKEKVTSPMGSGVIAIITILLVLILAIFSTLTLSTAQADLALARRGADTVRAYYEADGIARETLQEYRENPEWVEGLGILVPMNDLQLLLVEARRHGDGTVEILAWQTVLADDFEDYVDTTLPVFTGEE